MLGLNKAEGRTVVFISASALPALVRSTHPVAGFFSRDLMLLFLILPT